jgi:hypothetical protein
VAWLAKVRPSRYAYNRFPGKLFGFAVCTYTTWGYDPKLADTWFLYWLVRGYIRPASR